MLAAVQGTEGCPNHARRNQTAADLASDWRAVIWMRDQFFFFFFFSVVSTQNSTTTASVGLFVSSAPSAGCIASTDEIWP